MRDLDIEVERLRIAEGRLDPGVAQPLLHLVDRHPALEGQRGCRMPENVRRDMDGDMAAGDDPLDIAFKRLFSDAVDRIFYGNEQRRIVIRPGGEISAEGDFGFGVEERRPALSAFSAADENGVVCEVYVLDLHGNYFGDTGSC